MLVATQLQRTFLFEQQGQEIKLSDPSAAMSVEAVQNFYAQTYPLLNNAKIEGPEIKNDEVQYSFVSTLGTKG